MIQGAKAKAGKPQGPQGALEGQAKAKVRFKSYGEEMIEKVVRQSGSSGRVYLPQEWVGKCVRIIRLD